jgi:hypothetical protein
VALVQPTRFEPDYLIANATTKEIELASILNQILIFYILE